MLFRDMRRLARGVPSVVSRRRLTPTERFWDDVLPGDHECCWLWQGSLNVNGYPTFLVEKGHRVMACRMLFKLTRGVEARGDVIHMCHVRQCMNPDHIAEAPHGAALRRERLRGQWRQICAFGHPNVQENAHIDHTGKTLVTSCKMCRKKHELIDELVIEALLEAEEKNMTLSEADLKELRVMAKEEVVVAQRTRSQELMQTSVHMAFLSPGLRKPYTCRRCGKPGHNVRKCLENSQISGHIEEAEGP